MIRLLLPAMLIFAFATTTSAQVIKRYHQNFQIDSISTLTLEVEGDVMVNTWAGNTLLVEISVTSENGSNSVLNLLHKEGRYDLNLQTSDGNGVLGRKMKHTQNIKVKGIDMDESIKYTISVPDSFNADDLQTMRSFRKGE